MKARVLISLATLLLACSSTDDKKGHASGGTTGSGATGTGGTSVVTVTGGSSNASGGSANGTSSSGGSANGTSSDAGKTAADLRANACNGWTNEPEVLPVVLMLVVDNSASMNDRPNRQQSGGTKWEITRDALAATLDGMPATAAVGVLFYPNMDTRGSDVERPIDQCVNINQMIPVDLLGDSGSAQRSTIATSLTNTRPAGSTPTHDAYDYALVHGMQESRLTGNRFMLLITDGAPTLAKGCQGGGLPTTPAPTDPIVDEVLAARQAGVRSFLIGSPGSESVNGMDARAWLSEAAVWGATAREGCSLYGPDYCHIDLSQDADFKSALNAALARILGLITSCTFDVPATGKDGETVNQNQINVIYTPGNGSGEQLVGRDDTPDCQDGWQFDADGRIVLCSNTCFVAQNDPDGKVELLFGCDSVNTGDVR
jgi:Mg-chelatase subunit ChlD